MPASLGIDWEKLRVAYVNSSLTAAQFAKEHKISVDAVRKRAERGNWNDERRALSRAVAATAQSQIVLNRSQQLIEMNQMDVKLSQALRALAARMLTDIQKQIGDGKRKVSPNDARTIASIAEAAQKIGRIALDATTENLGHAGVAGAPPMMFGAAPPEAVQKAMREYLHDF